MHLLRPRLVRVLIEGYSRWVRSVNVPLLRFVARRLVLIPVSLFVVTTVAFGLVTLLPGDPAIAIAGGYATPETLATIRHGLELDRPLYVRYIDYLARASHGDLGNSFFTDRPVVGDIIQYLPNTIELIVLSLALAILIGMGLGIVAAYFRGRWPAPAASALITAIQAIPDFFLGLLLIYIMFFRLHLAPAPFGRLAPTDIPPPAVTHFLIVDCILAGRWQTLVSALYQSLLPVLTLGVVYAAYFGKTARAVLATALDSSHIEFARACGLPTRQVIGYAVLIGRTPIMTYVAILFGTLIGGEAIVETIFGWQGVGQWALQGILKVDVPVIQGFVILSGFFTLLIYLLLDIVVTLLDPRISYG